MLSNLIVFCIEVNFDCKQGALSPFLCSVRRNREGESESKKK